MTSGSTATSQTACNEKLETANQEYGQIPAMSPDAPQTCKGTSWTYARRAPATARCWDENLDINLQLMTEALTQYFSWYRQCIAGHLLPPKDITVGCRTNAQP